MQWNIRSITLFCLSVCLFNLFSLPLTNSETVTNATDVLFQCIIIICFLNDIIWFSAG